MGLMAIIKSGKISAPPDFAKELLPVVCQTYIVLCCFIFFSRSCKVYAYCTG